MDVAVATVDGSVKVKLKPQLQRGPIRCQPMRSKALNPAENELVTRMIQQILNDDFGGVVVRTAKALGVSHATIFDLLGGKRGAGMHLLTALANYKRIPIEQILGRATLSGTSSASADGEVIPGPLTQAIEGKVWPEEVRRALRVLDKGQYTKEVWEQVGLDLMRALKWADTEMKAMHEKAPELRLAKLPSP